MVARFVAVSALTLTLLVPTLSAGTGKPRVSAGPSCSFASVNIAPCSPCVAISNTAREGALFTIFTV